jgi:VIT1/CCC1 family predicted Fe2+/Mn2+ transporter
VPDIPVFDATSFFALKRQEVEQALIAKRAELAIAQANRQNLLAALTVIAGLSPEELRTVQHEQASLKEVLTTTERSINAIEAEVQLLSSKLATLIRLGDDLAMHQLQAELREKEAAKRDEPGAS